MPRARARATRLFFAADLHGSEPTFRKFLKAAEFYGADALVFGGDLMGKALVPIVRTGDRYRSRFQGRDHDFDAEELAGFTRAVEFPGFYWTVVEPDEHDALQADPLAQRGLWHELASRRLRSWIELAEERLDGTGVRMYLTGGNDDEPSVLETLDRHDGTAVVAAEGRVVELDDEHTMITVGLSTPTPWDTPREADEAVIEAAIQDSLDRVPDPARCVFNLHCPPKGTVIDVCAALRRGPDGELRPIRSGGRMQMTSGGSEAVRDLIARAQPIVGLHGHIHESAGRVRIGRTPCFNPGSEYVQGTLNGWIVALRGPKLSAYQHTSG